MRRIHARLPLIAALCVVAAIVVVLVAAGGDESARAKHTTNVASVHAVTLPKSHPHIVTGVLPDHQGSSGSQRPAAPRRRAAGTRAPRRSQLRVRSATFIGNISREIGQLIISTYAGTVPPESMLAAVRAGDTGAVILMGDNTAGGVASTRNAVDELQSAARAGGNPGLLVMTDQEGGEVKRLPGPPEYAAAAMGNSRLAFQQGNETGTLLRQAGVNLDLAPVADVSRIDGFMEQEQRSFGTDPRQVAQSACAFAQGLERQGIGYTLKHFPGLGDAIDSTDDQPVQIDESAADIYADDLAYRKCGHGPYTSVMVSSASYLHLTGATPAVLSPTIYRRVMPAEEIDALTMSDTFEGGAIENLQSPAMSAINAGLDMVMYPDEESASAYAYKALLADAHRGALSATRVAAAADAVLAFKRNLGLGG
jgi:beta-N-acetylhexosaminidase